MIVSGGENVFPQEIADVLARHDAVADVAVFGVDDAEFGQRLRGLRRHPARAAGVRGGTAASCQGHGRPLQGSPRGAIFVEAFRAARPARSCARRLSGLDDHS